MHGYGRYIWKDGRKYEGYYENNKKHGKGVYTYSDGSMYKGDWVEGVQHGEGCIIDADQAVERKGWWNHGKLKSWVKESPSPRKKQ